MQDVDTIGLTGGPCAGKTTGKNYVAEKLSDYGYGVIIVPEAATELFMSGVRIHGPSGVGVFNFQKQIIERQIENENRYRHWAGLLPSPKRLVICDRGVMDCGAYMDAGEFAALVESMGWNVARFLARYKGVFHLVTAADGAEAFYTTVNNPARRETPEEARVADRLTQEVWVGHQHLRVVDNSTDFEGKMRRLLAAICRVIGIPAPLEIERRFLVESPNISNIITSGIKVVGVFIEQRYLKSETDLIRRIRKRGQEGHFVYYQTEKREIKPGVRAETEKEIGPLEYLRLSREACDSAFDVIEKRRYCFLWRGQYFELDIFEKPKRLAGLTILEIELTEENDKIDIPPFLKVITEITQDTSFSNRELARRPS
ncbi:MAG: AAA family ATPase [Candidatus Sungiibacteriota bacterium]|uniref:AAA family ATPase n=1 Tax=Candidatus Sungiibacteriota bacterium TaxID=2750080 RepID=A0A7T5RJI3_9BACT|nr:MAG: AAA family ATPase [Candidatus Sungbacteria bacterium]